MRGTANTSTGGRFCGRAVHGISNLSSEDMRQIEAHRHRERPTPWPHLAVRFGVNEIDLRRLFEPKNDNQPAAAAIPPRPTVVLTVSEREARFRTLWITGAPKAEIAALMAMTHSQMDRVRVKLGLAKRADGVKPNGWTRAQDAYIREHYVIGGETAESVAAVLGRTKNGIVGRAHRQGWTRKSLAGMAS